ncbi:unnamed protein product [Dovyalis caffra]|uniref:Protein Iojap, chloroplastic n=1 Tax=Dovyalis caffra TaxID=77055 RepID=A0AAV1SUX7_9ROSI|nr:unnamed protein product [Dovyalis caffra]
MAVSTALSIAGAGAGARFSGEFQQLCHMEARLFQKPRKHAEWLCFYRHRLPHYYKCFCQEIRTEKLSFNKSLALRKDSDDSFLSNVEDTDEMFDDLFNKYGEVVFRSNDTKPPTAEVDDDAESLSFAVEMAKVASDVKASDIRVLFVKPLVYWTRFFIIATAFSRPQIDAIKDLAEKKYGKVPSGDSKPNSWTLLDFGKFLNDNPLKISLLEDLKAFNRVHMAVVFGWQTKQVSPLPVSGLLGRRAEAGGLNRNFYGQWALLAEDIPSLICNGSRGGVSTSFKYLFWLLFLQTVLEAVDGSCICESQVLLLTAKIECITIHSCSFYSSR